MAIKHLRWILMKQIETVHIIGLGALGMLYGSVIEANLGPGHVSFVMDADRYERHRNEEYRINKEPVSFHKIKSENASPCDLVIVAVKYTDLDSALETMKNSVGEDTLILSVMNGISTEEIIGARYGKERVIHSVAQGMDAMHFGTELIFSRSGQIHIGITDPAMQEQLDRLVEFLNRAGQPYIVEDDIIYRMWSKFMVNVGINQTCMIYNTDYEGVLTDSTAEYMTLVSAMREVILLANAEGVPVTEQDLKDYLDLMRSFNPKATPSMGQDRINGRRSEVELFAGTVIRMAEKHSIPVPANTFIYRRVKEIEANY